MLKLELFYLCNIGNIKAVGSVLWKYNNWLRGFVTSLAFRIEVSIFEKVPEVEYIITNVNCSIYFGRFEKNEFNLKLLLQIPLIFHLADISV